MNQRNRHLLRSGWTAGVLAGALALSGCHGGSRPATATPGTSAPSPADTPAADKAPGTTITGTLLWNGPGPRLYRVHGSARTTVLSGLKAYAAELSPDGRRLVYVDESAGPDKAGDLENARNPNGSAACRPLSADRTGRRITAALGSVGGAGSGQLTADALVDTETGDVLPLPVSGRVTGLLFGPDGNLLIRTADGDTSTLSVLAPDGTLLVRAREPAEVGDAELLAYTR